MTESGWQLLYCTIVIASYPNTANRIPEY